MEIQDIIQELQDTSHPTTPTLSKVSRGRAANQADSSAYLPICKVLHAAPASGQTVPHGPDPISKMPIIIRNSRLEPASEIQDCPS